MAFHYAAGVDTCRYLIPAKIITSASRQLAYVKHCLPLLKLLGDMQAWLSLK